MSKLHTDGSLPGGYHHKTPEGGRLLATHHTAYHTQREHSTQRDKKKRETAAERGQSGCAAERQKAKSHFALEAAVEYAVGDVEVRPNPGEVRR